MNSKVAEMVNASDVRDNNVQSSLFTKVRKRVGFTVIELLVVMMLLGIMAGGFQVVFSNNGESAKQVKAKTEINQIINSLNSYFMRFGTYPGGTSQQILTKLNEVGVISSNNLLDPWGKTYGIGVNYNPNNGLAIVGDYVGAAWCMTNTAIHVDCMDDLSNVGSGDVMYILKPQ